jgi:hypothetical protein
VGELGTDETDHLLRDAGRLLDGECPCPDLPEGSVKKRTSASLKKGSAQGDMT